MPEWVELANGCLCCSVKAEFVQALEALIEGHAGRFDHVLVETTGGWVMCGASCCSAEAEFVQALEDQLLLC